MLILLYTSNPRQVLSHGRSACLSLFRRPAIHDTPVRLRLNIEGLLDGLIDSSKLVVCACPESLAGRPTAARGLDRLVENFVWPGARARCPRPSPSDGSCCCPPTRRPPAYTTSSTFAPLHPFQPFALDKRSSIRHRRRALKGRELIDTLCSVPPRSCSATRAGCSAAAARPSAGRSR